MFYANLAFFSIESNRPSMEKIAYFYLKSTYVSPKTDIHFTKNGYTFHQKRIYVSPKTEVRFHKNGGTFSKKGIYVFILKNIASYLALY